MKTKARKPSTQRQILDALLRIEKLLQTPRTIDDRAAETNERLRKHGFRWEFNKADNGCVNHYILHRDGPDGGETQVMVIPIEAGRAEWHLTERASWRPEPSLGHALVAAAEAFMETIK